MTRGSLRIGSGLSMVMPACAHQGPDDRVQLRHRLGVRGATVPVESDHVRTSDSLKTVNI